MEDTRSIDFYFTVLGRTLEHLGVQMYKHRDVAIAELVANSWDAGASKVHIQVPDERQYDKDSSEITIIDDGFGMNDDQVQNEYLVVGRNRRLFDKPSKLKRPVMGRKGIGKLAGFGIASNMTVRTWTRKQSTTFKLDIADLKKDAGITEEVPIKGIIGPPPADGKYPTGTELTLRDLKHPTPINLNGLCEALSRRFSRSVRGEMKIYVNGAPIGEPNLELAKRVPESGYADDVLPSGAKIKYFYGFSNSLIRSRQLQGFTIFVRGKTAQAPPFFFNVENVATGLHYARYMTGAIEADFLDEGFDDDSDLISTDRQEVDWADKRTQELREWGEKLTRRALREWSDAKGEHLESRVMQNEEIAERINQLEKSAQKRLSQFLKQLGKSDTAPEHSYDLADALVRAFEYRHFHDVIHQIEDVSDDPEQLSVLLTHLKDWKVLESRAILEIIRGRIEIIEKFHGMIVNNVPETASSKNRNNMHDLLAGYPWLLNAEWQVLSEEKKISTQLREWHFEDVTDEDERLRYDFLALSDDRRLVVIEIKRADHAVRLDELQRLEKYREKLALAKNQDLYMLLICGGNFKISSQQLAIWQNRPDGEILTWGDVYERTNRYYKHYKAVLEGDIKHVDFFRKEQEIAQTREVLQSGTVHRNPETRKQGLGPQDVDYK